MISNYIATYKYAVFTTKTEKQQVKFVEKLILNGVAVFSIDSSPCLYMGIEGKLTSLPFEVNYKYGHMQANLELDNEFFSSLPEFFQIYITNSIGASIFERNLAPGNIENDYILLFLSSIVLYIDGHRVFAYPTIKLYKSGIIMIDLSVYSSDDKMEDDVFVDFLINLRTTDYDKVLMSESLLNYKGLNCVNEEDISRDGISRRYGEYTGEHFGSLKDLAIFLVDEIINESETFIAHHNFSIESEDVDNKCIQALMNGINYEAVKDFCKVDYTDYREFKNSHKHFVSVGITITVGNIEDTRIPSLVIDELFLFMAAKVFQLRNIINLGKNSIEDILDLYNNVINIKGYLINGLSAYSFSKRIFDDLFNEYGMYEQLDNIKELIEVEIKKLEVRNNHRETNSQKLIAIVLTLLSSEALMTYFTRPLYLEYHGLKVEQLTIYENMLMFSMPLLIVIAFIVVLKIFRRK